MISFGSLLQAAHSAARGKRFKPSVARFIFDLERQLLLLHEELASKIYRPGPYRTFTIYEGKTRQISAAPFRDRVVHHALTGILEPIFERSFIFDSYACRKGKGTHAAVDRCQQFARRYRYVLKADVRKYFPSIDHTILKTLITRKIKDPHVLWLVATIIDHSNPQDPVLMWFPGDDLFTPTERRRGLPLGNQTSQFFANVYLDPLDHFVTDHLGLSYVRYVDDFLVFADDKRRLHEVKLFLTVYSSIFLHNLAFAITEAALAPAQYPRREPTVRPVEPSAAEPHRPLEDRPCTVPLTPLRSRNRFPSCSTSVVTKLSRSR